MRGSGLGGGIGSILYSDRVAGENPGREYFVYSPAVGHVTATLTGDLPTNVAVKSTNLYEAFGRIVKLDGASWTITDGPTSGASENNRLANTKERDRSIGLDNHGMRYYDPEIGRYTTRDPIGYGGGPKVYLSVHNNPINFIDPLGLCDICGNTPCTCKGDDVPLVTDAEVETLRSAHSSREQRWESLLGEQMEFLAERDPFAHILAQRLTGGPTMSPLFTIYGSELFGQRLRWESENPAPEPMINMNVRTTAGIAYKAGLKGLARNIVSDLEAGTLSITQMSDPGMIFGFAPETMKIDWDIVDYAKSGTQPSPYYVIDVLATYSHERQHQRDFTERPLGSFGQAIVDLAMPGNILENRAYSAQGRFYREFERALFRSGGFSESEQAIYYQRLQTNMRNERMELRNAYRWRTPSIDR